MIYILDAVPANKRSWCMVDRLVIRLITHIRTVPIFIKSSVATHTLVEDCLSKLLECLAKITFVKTICLSIFQVLIIYSWACARDKYARIYSYQIRTSMYQFATNSYVCMYLPNMDKYIPICNKYVRILTKYGQVRTNLQQIRTYLPNMYQFATNTYILNKYVHTYHFVTNTCHFYHKYIHIYY